MFLFIVSKHEGVNLRLSNPKTMSSCRAWWWQHHAVGLFACQWHWCFARSRTKIKGLPPNSPASLQTKGKMLDTVQDPKNTRPRIEQSIITLLEQTSLSSDLNPVENP
ncbi:hypothetical protein ILYODFUR_025544 [Ilyodon furcidens]|uniref:Uncharacterized protein n=1 Tax=Ilyodon furcidens TaxID=33524 RepID=A0ABV0U0I9_9TELE